MGKLHDKVVLITGSASGIGKACAIEAAKEGASIAVADLANAQPEEIAKAFIWLASDDASFVTGSAILVEGGYTVQ